MPMSAGYIPFHPNPSKPKYKPPAGAVDAHCHVFGPEAVFPYAPERKYTPCDAPKEKLFSLRDFLGFDKNVIVQASCHSKDNRAMVDALDASHNKAKGVAFVGEEVTDTELKWMDRAGVKGVPAEAEDAGVPAAMLSSAAVATTALPRKGTGATALPTASAAEQASR